MSVNDNSLGGVDMRFSEGILDQFCSVQGRFDAADVSPLGKSDAALGEIRQNSPELIFCRHPLDFFEKPVRRSLLCLKNFKCHFREAIEQTARKKISSLKTVVRLDGCVIELKWMIDSYDVY